MNEDRFISFTDTQGTMHTYRLVDIQAVGVGKNDGRTECPSYVRAFGFPLTVPLTEAIQVRKAWMSYYDD